MITSPADSALAGVGSRRPRSMDSPGVAFCRQAGAPQASPPRNALVCLWFAVEKPRAPLGAFRLLSIAYRMNWTDLWFGHASPISGIRLGPATGAFFPVGK
jgi:hypothetical protein